MTIQKFEIGQKVVYPSHGLGEITNIETQKISSFEIKLYVISFPDEKLTVRVPVNKAESSGLRPLIKFSEIDNIYKILAGKAKLGNRMWSRRAQEYETKINSGDINAVAEVVRDLYKNTNSERSYSERTIYQNALNRLAVEISNLENIAVNEAEEKLLDVLREKIAAA